MANLPEPMQTVPEEVFQSDVPESFARNKYFALNDEYAIGLQQAYAEAAEIAKDFESWQVAYAKLRAEDINVEAAAKAVKKSPATCRKFHSTLGYKKLLSHYQCIRILKSPIPKDFRANALWRLYVDNVEDNPDVARKSINDLNAMLDPKTHGGGMTLNIQINNEKLPRGPLDG